MEKKIRKVLVANRGEIAIRIFRACFDAGVRTVAIYSKEDKLSLFRTKADEAYLIGENRSPLGAYLGIEEIIALAKRKNVDAIHPGYGFLSENADFARACEEAGIIFIGPPSQILDQMGDKLHAKEVARRCGVPVIPGSEKPVSGVEEAVRIAEEAGYPVILKAAAGGGGRGMRRADNAEEIARNFELVRNEARKSFGNDDIFVEKFLEEPKHIEVQILADQYGNVVHLFERDCSVQRRYQKVVEFTPAFGISPEKRQQLYDDAVKIAREVGYVNAGTVEFLVDKHGNHYFIEMNPRIQVEHTVTEMVTGIDLVRAQIDIAQGLPLSHPYIGIESQDSIKLSGYAIQCRVTTEDPTNNFAPDTGKLTTYRSGGGFGIRLDAGNAFTGAEITPYYDSLLVKITAFDRTFEGAVRKAKRGMGEIRIRGVKTNMSFLNNILSHPTFVAGKCHTKFIEETPSLFDVKESKDRATKVLRYIGNTIVSQEEGFQKPILDNPRLPDPASLPEITAPNLRELLREGGAKALTSWVKDQKKLLITDTTFRDAHQSLLATRVRTRDLTAIAEPTAHILQDAFSLEVWGGATFDTCYRFLHESPWERLDQLCRAIPNIPFQMLVRGINGVGYHAYPDNVIREFIREAARSGIDIFRIFDSFNNPESMRLAIETVKEMGKVAEVSFCYTDNILAPKYEKYSLDYYLKLAKQLEAMGADILCIKDMGGLLRPLAAKKLVTELRQVTDLPIHLHTHDTSGNQIAALMMAADAGVDIVDTAISSMSSLTSQPSMNSLVTALEGSDRETGFDPRQLQKLSDYWEDTRKYYSGFEGDIKVPETEIYRYEIPGGQYTNLKPQVESLGLGHQFEEVKEKYSEVNDLLGGVIKVTPSSKMVGDFAIFMVQNKLDRNNILERGKELTFPRSVVDYFKGMMGQSTFPLPQELSEVVLKGEKPLDTLPSKLLPPADFDAIVEKLRKINPAAGLRQAIAYCLYPQVVEDFLAGYETYGDISQMPSDIFFYGMDRGESMEMSIEEGKTLMIKYIGPGERNDDGTLELQFELNGSRRNVLIRDPHAEVEAEQIRLASAEDKSEIGATIMGAVSRIAVKPGDKVKKGDVVAIVEAMKMETGISAAIDGVVEAVYAQPGDIVQAGQLLVRLKI